MKHKHSNSIPPAPDFISPKLPFNKKKLSAAIATSLLLTAPWATHAANIDLSTSALAVSEDAGTLTININVSLVEEPDPERNCRVDGELLVSGTATNGEDFTISSTDFQVFINSGVFDTEEGGTFFETTRDSVSIAITDDNFIEPDEDFTVSITNAQENCGFYSGLDSSEELTFTITDNGDTEEETTTSIKRAVTNSKVIASARTLPIMAADLQIQNLSKQLRRLRQGLRGNDINGLQLDVDGQTLSGTQLNQLLGNGAGDGELISDWGTFVGGTVRVGDQDKKGNTSDFEFGISSLFTGVDYRLNDNIILGGVLGYTDSSTDSDENAGKTELTGYSVGLFSSYYRKDSFYVDGIITLGHSDYSTKRNIDSAANPLYAYGETNGSELSLALNSGYYLYLQQYFLHLFGSLNYVSAKIDDFDEKLKSGTSTSLLSVDDQEIKSLTSNAGAQLGWTINTSAAVLTPQISLDWEHQYENDTQVISGEFIGDPSNATFNIDTGKQDRDYFNLGLTLSAVYRGGFSSYITYETDLGRDDLDVYDLSLGGRWEF